MREVKHPPVYILASRYRGTLYTGVTSSLWQRVWDHRNERFDGFTARYAVKTLVWYEHHHSMEDAIRREKRGPRFRGGDGERALAQGGERRHQSTKVISL
jgi:putative endonuclease